MRVRLVVGLTLLGSILPGAASRAEAPPNPGPGHAADRRHPLTRRTLGFSCADTDLGVTIVAFDPTDWAVCPGLYRHDVLVTVNGVAVKAARDVDALLPSLEPFKPVILEVRRFQGPKKVTIIPRSYVALSPGPVVIRAEAPQVPERVVPASAAAAAVNGDMNVITHALLDPATGDVEFIGRYDPRFPTGNVPYKDLLNTALEHPNASVSLNAIEDDERRLEEWKELCRKQVDPYSVVGEALEGEYALALLYGHPALDRERQQFIRLSSRAYGLAAEEFARLHNFLFVENDGTSIPPDVVEPGVRMLRHTGYGATADAWRVYATRPSADGYRETLTILGRREGELPGSLRIQALLAMLGTFRTYGPPVPGVVVPTWARRWSGMLEEVDAGHIDERLVVVSMMRALLPRVAGDGVDDIFGTIVENLRFSREATNLVRLAPPVRIHLFTDDVPRESQLARIMYEADYHLKTFFTVPELFEHVARHRPVPDAMKHEYSMCWQPADVRLDVSPDRRTVGFGPVNMAIRVTVDPEAVGGATVREEQPKDTDDDLPAAYFADVASRIDEYAAVIPVFHELREAAKVMALARWIRRHKLHVAVKGDEHVAWSPPAFFPKPFVRRLECRKTLTAFARDVKRGSDPGGATFRASYDWVASRVDPDVANALPSALVLSNDLGQQASQAAIHGELEKARNLAELSAQAMTGALTRQELSRMQPTVRFSPVARVAMSPQAVRSQRAISRAIWEEVRGVQQGTVSSDAAAARFARAQDALREVRTNPSVTLPQEFLSARPLGESRRAPGRAVPKKPTSIALVAVPVVGRTRMGSVDGERGRKASENRVDVELTAPFMMSMTEVTQRQFREVMGTAPWVGKPFGRSGDDMPATWVTWHEAVAFCDTLTLQLRASGGIPDDESFRLPTEAEWECACRAGTVSAHNFGTSEPRSALGQHRWFTERQLAGHAWFAENTIRRGEPFAHDVRTKLQNPWGLYDMHGNAMEWCLDWYGPVLSGGVDPRGPAQGTMRVCRGGSWGNEAVDCRSASRFAVSPEERNGFIGFRVVRARLE